MRNEEREKAGGIQRRWMVHRIINTIQSFNTVVTEKFDGPCLVNDKASIIRESSFALNFDFCSIFYYPIEPEKLGFSSECLLFT